MEALPHETRQLMSLTENSSKVTKE